MKTRLFILGCCLLFVTSQIFFCGCATLNGGVRQLIEISSKQKPTRIFIDGKLRGTAPLSTEISRWGSHRIRIEAPGYKPCEFRFEKEYNTIANMNGVIGIAPIAIDLVTAAIINQIVPKDALKSNGHQIVRINPLEIFSSMLSLTIDLEPQPPTRHRHRTS